MRINFKMLTVLAASLVLMLPHSEAAMSGSTNQARYGASFGPFHRYWEQFPRPKVLEVVHKPSSPNGDEVPVVSLHYALWNRSGNAGQGDPKKIAEAMNGLPHAGPPAGVDHFSAVIIHAWSWFR